MTKVSAGRCNLGKGGRGEEEKDPNEWEFGCFFFGCGWWDSKSDRLFLTWGFEESFSKGGCSFRWTIFDWFQDFFGVKEIALCRL